MYRWLLLVTLAGCDLIFDVDVPDGEIGFIQQRADSTNSATGEIAFFTPVTKGNLIIVGVDWVGDVDFVGIDDTAHDDFEEVGSEVNSGFIKARLFYAADVAGGPCTVTVQLSAAPEVLEIYLTEYTGVAREDPLDAAAVNFDSTNLDVTSTARLNETGDLIFAYSVDGTVTAGPGFTTRSTFMNNLTMEMIAGEPGLYTATATATGGWSIHMAAFRRAFK